MYQFLVNLDRRWVFLLMAIAVTTCVLLQLRFPEQPTQLSRDVFAEIERLQPVDPVVLAFDFDPASAGELTPMATAFVHHCCEKKLKMYFLALWPVGPQMIDEAIETVIKQDYPELVYGRDYVNLGFKSGGEGVIKVIVNDLRGLYTTDAAGTNIDDLPMCKDFRSIQDSKLVINVSAGYPGSKEWVQYAASVHPDKIRVVTGCTGVQSPLLFPYIPNQLPGLLAAIKGAAEYEVLVNEKVQLERGIEPDPRYLEGQRRMGPQLVAHVLMVGLILLGNLVYFLGRAQGR